MLTYNPLRGNPGYQIKQAQKHAEENHIQNNSRPENLQFAKEKQTSMTKKHLAQ